MLVDEDGAAIGTAPKQRSHNAETPLHLAFSCYVFDTEGRFLLSRRAWHKKTWPGQITNSCCGHPAPGEAMTQAVSRRLGYELGLAVAADNVDLLLPDFRYRAVMGDGIVENELCPVYRVITESQPDPNPEEVAEAWWLPWGEVLAGATDGSVELSPWSLLQLPKLIELGPDPLAWPLGEPDRLFTAARNP
ncbi:isopentenyl-diphosphate Delta-isomerase [Pseudonocardiaceae bacterium YIM PH 21723]|nr:isopentenyl-diphosphate Delta-isomerase [Pseudonocardiaceae bacterium YIM PH 21723]